MAVRALNFKLDEAEIREMKRIAGVFNITVTELVKEAIEQYIAELKNDPFYRLTVCVEDASAEESEELLEEINKLSDDDLTITASKRFTV